MKTPQSETNSLERFRLQLSKDAHREWKESFACGGKGFERWERFWHIHDWAGKLPGAAARVAGLLHCATHVNAQPWSTSIELTTMEKALTLLAVLADHASQGF